MFKMWSNYWEKIQQTAVSWLSYLSAGKANWSFYSLGSWGALRIQENGPEEKPLLRGSPCHNCYIDIGKDIT